MESIIHQSDMLTPFWNYMTCFDKLYLTQCSTKIRSELGKIEVCDLCIWLRSQPAQEEDEEPSDAETLHWGEN